MENNKVSLKTAPPLVISEYLESLLDKAYEIESNDPNKDDYNYENPIWIRLFNTVFSDEISRIIYKRFPDFEPYIPDTTYGEDVRSFIEKFKDYSRSCGSRFQTFEEWLDEIKENN